MKLYLERFTSDWIVCLNAVNGKWLKIATVQSIFYIQVETTPSATLAVYNVWTTTTVSIKQMFRLHNS